MDDFGELLSRYMYRTGINDGKLAYKIKVSRQTVFHWRNGKITRPNCDKVRLCAAALRLTPEEKLEFVRAAGCPYQDLEVAEPEPNYSDPAPPSLPNYPPPEPTLTFDGLVVPVTGVPIGTPKQFFGRNRELKRVFSKWQHLPLQNIAVVGPKRSGKTSLLRYIKNIHAAREVRAGQTQHWLPNPDDYQFIFIDFQAADMCEEDSLLRYILAQMELEAPDPCDLASFTRIVRQQLKRRTLLLMDEVTAGLQSPKLPDEFWWGIRSLISHHPGRKLGMLLASHKAPAEWGRQDDDNSPSPLLNIIGRTVKMGPFTEDEALELLRHAPTTISDADQQWMLEHSGGWPAKLQVLCDVWWTGQQENQSTEEWQQEALDEMENFQHLL
ncbi:MAG: AAA family ATPase [Pseudomonadota bacterium]